jgi:hypothetical protein
MSIEDQLALEKLVSRKPESYWNELIQIEKEKRKKNKEQRVKRGSPAVTPLISPRHANQSLMSGS